jgi:uncharacterized protein YjiS (DUF1127 family)
MHYISGEPATQNLSIHRGMTMFDFIKTRYSRWQRYSRTVSELERLSHRELADLGLTTYDIPRVAREASRF